MIPGMMAGQLLGGQRPIKAGIYQVMIMYMVTTSGCIASSCVVGLACVTLFDTGEHALRRDRIKQVVRSGPKRDVVIASLIAAGDVLQARLSRLRRVGRLGYSRVVNYQDSLSDTEQRYYAILENNSGKHPQSQAASVILQAENIVVERTRLHVSFALRARSITSLSGPSGSGKSTLLRVIARIDPHCNGELLLGGDPWSKILAPVWRTRVIYIPQDRPTLSGSPCDFYRSLLKYRAQQIRHSGVCYKEDGPKQIAADWRMDASKLDQSWATLSGGEAQRASLAIALALKPDVLLLDEVSTPTW